jgi:ATP-dependent RNA helicase RhlE
MTFTELELAEPILRAVASEGYNHPTPIQAQSIPVILAGRDLLGCAQTGTGKTAAFALPILHRLWTNRPAPGSGRKIRALILSPTRELAAQIEESFCAYGKNTPLRTAVIYGGVNQNPQVKALRNGIDILVATPGRLLDLMNQGHVDLKSVEVFVLDEADRMLDLGFFPDIRKVVARLPEQRQTMLFSATMPRDIRELANTILSNPANVQIAPVAATADLIEQGVYLVTKRNKSVLLKHLLKSQEITRALVFTRTKRAADKLVKQLQIFGIRSAAIHGDKSQANRERSLDSFRSGKVPVLVATDIAARGIDVDAVTHVFNYDVPHEAETYVHRIGRTGRAGAAGIAFSFCDHEERGSLRAIERLIGKKIPVQADHPEYPKSTEGSTEGSLAATSEDSAISSDETDLETTRPGRSGDQGGFRPDHKRSFGKRPFGKRRPGKGKRSFAPRTSAGGEGAVRREATTQTPHTSGQEGRPAGHLGQRSFRPHEQNRGGSGNRSRGRRRNRGRPAGSGSGSSSSH